MDQGRREAVAAGVRGLPGLLGDQFPQSRVDRTAELGAAAIATAVTAHQVQGLAVLEQACYQCHPGKTTKCLRGAMFNGGMLCNDCHGNMQQVGNDFSLGVTPSNPNAFKLGLGNFYDPASAQPRVSHLG